jgi:4-hydroxy-tetrahydrodipicolinate synthase
MGCKLSSQEIRHNLTGPNATVRTPFQRDGSIDYDGLRNLLDFIIDAGSRSVILTIGDSLFSLLTDQEVAELTKATVEHVAGRAMVIVADKYWWTGKAVEFAQYARGLGADLVMVSPPDWGASATPETYKQHYAAVADVMPVMIVTDVFRQRGMQFGLDTIKLLVEEVDSVVAIKDDFAGEFGRRMCLMVHDKWAVYSGGFKQNHLDVVPYGCDGYLSTFITFKPDIAHTYWKAVQAKDFDKVQQIMKDIELPFWDCLMSLPGGGVGKDGAIHAVYELYGITERWRRSPYYNLNDKEMEKLVHFLKSKKLQ